MTFSYPGYEVEPMAGQGGATTVYRPVVPVRVIGPTGAAVIYGLLDTGADETVLPRAMTELIGVEIDPGKSATVLSASGELPMSYGEVGFAFGKGRASYRWRAPVGIVDQPWETAVLGRASFLCYFDVTFFGEKREVRLRRNGIPLPNPK